MTEEAQEPREEPQLVEHRWKCGACQQISTDSERLVADSPFDVGETVMGCPHCRTLNFFYEACDVAGCPNLATRKWVSEIGSRRVCEKHSTTI